MKNVHRMPRTDLALERIDRSMPLPPGVRCEEEAIGTLLATRITIETDEAASAMGKPVGQYLTLEPADFKLPSQTVEADASALAKTLSKWLPKDGLVLVAGLGNEGMTPDALGPLCIKRILATRHLIGMLQEEAEWVHALRPVAALSPGVLGQTGVETAELLGAVCRAIHPAAVVVVDALAAASLDRLGRTVQLCDSGISPGSGVQNRRAEISQKTLGCPVFSVGVPMVVSLSAIQNDLPEMMVVTPQEVDAIVRHAAEMVALGINLALQPALTAEEILGLTV